MTTTIEQLRQQEQFRLRKLSETAADLAKKSHPAEWLRLAEIIELLLECDLEENKHNERSEMRIDNEGFPLDHIGYRILNADRRYLPFEVEDERFKLEPLVGEG